MKLDRFIKRPVLSTVISVLTVILGLLGLVSLPIEQYPDIAPPTVNVQTFYQGADAQTVQKSVLAPLEEQINGVEGMTYMTSTATNDGMAMINVYFEQGYDADMAQVNVQNRVSQATSLPSMKSAAWKCAGRAGSVSGLKVLVSMPLVMPESFQALLDRMPSRPWA